MPSFYPEGNTVKSTDNELRTLHKIAGMAGGEGGGGLSGSGSPEGVVTASAGATYVNTDTGDFYWKSTDGGNTGWLP